MIRRPAMGDRRTTDVRATTIVKNNFPPRANEREMAAKFAAVVCRIAPETLAEAAGGRSVEVAKLWKSGLRCPNTTSLLSMAKSLPAVAAWVEDEILPGKRQPVTPASDLSAIVARLQTRALMGGEDGAIARAMLAMLTGAG